MPEVFSNVIDLVGGLLIAEKKKKKKLKVVPSKYPSTAISAIKPRVRVRPILPIYVPPPAPFIAPFATARPRGRPKGSKGRKALLLEDDARLASALASSTLEASSRRRGARRESEASRPKKSALSTASESERGEKSTGSEKPRRRKAKAPAEELAPLTIFPVEREPTTPGKLSGLKKDGTPSLSSTRGKELAALVLAGEIPPFVPIRASPMATAKRVASKPPPATKPKVVSALKKEADALKKKDAADMLKLEQSLFKPGKNELKRQEAKAKKAPIVEMPGFPAAIGSGMRRRRKA